ncbi:MAG: DUF6489 family protein [Pseudomonadota bacterium]
MKITVDIDCTPQEARAFLGLPNIEPMQDELLAQLQQQLSAYLANTDPEAMLKLWLPESMKGLGQIQEQFWRQFMTGMSGMTGGASSSDDSDNKKG